MPAFCLCHCLAQRQRLRVLARRLEQRRPFDIDLSSGMSGGECVIEQRRCFLEAVEARREPRTDVERGRGVGRRPRGLGGYPLRPVVVRDPAQEVATGKQKFRQREQILEARTFRTTSSRPSIDAARLATAIRPLDSVCRRS